MKADIYNGSSTVSDIQKKLVLWCETRAEVETDRLTLPSVVFPTKITILNNTTYFSITHLSLVNYRWENLPVFLGFCFFFLHFPPTILVILDKKSAEIMILFKHLEVLIYLSHLGKSDQSQGTNKCTSGLHWGIFCGWDHHIHNN